MKTVVQQLMKSISRQGKPVFKGDQGRGADQHAGRPPVPLIDLHATARQFWRVFGSGQCVKRPRPWANYVALIDWSFNDRTFAAIISPARRRRSTASDGLTIGYGESRAVLPRPPQSAFWAMV
jgi:hypothetical protein